MEAQRGFCPDGAQGGYQDGALDLDRLASVPGDAYRSLGAGSHELPCSAWLVGADYSLLQHALLPDHVLAL